MPDIAQHIDAPFPVGEKFLIDAIGIKAADRPDIEPQCARRQH